MLLSIITINYNNSIGLSETIKSVLSQTFTDFEWIVIDAGSTDGSRDLIVSIQDRLSFWCSEPDNGIWDALNKGIKHSSGRYLNFMNSGDTFVNENVLKSVFSNPVESDIIYGDTINVQNGSEQKIYHPSKMSLSYLLTLTINHQSAFINRQLQNRFLYDMKYRYAADRKFWIEALLSGASFQHIDLFVARYDYSGISSQNLNKVKDEHNAIIEEVLPPAIMEDYSVFFKMSKMFEDYPIIYSVFECLSKRGFYRVLSCLLRLFN